jgi:Flp pilus assembly protein CpaB
MTDREAFELALARSSARLALLLRSAVEARAARRPSTGGIRKAWRGMVRDLAELLRAAERAEREQRRRR